MPKTTKPLKDYKLSELQTLAKKLKVPYSNKRKADLLKDIRKAQRSPTKTKPPKTKAKPTKAKPQPTKTKPQPTKTKPLTPRRNQLIKVTKVPLSVSVHSKSVSYDSEKGTTIKECHNGQCKVTHIPLKSRSRTEPKKIQDEELYLPDVMSFYSELKK